MNDKQNITTLKNCGEGLRSRLEVGEMRLRHGSFLLSITHSF